MKLLTKLKFLLSLNHSERMHERMAALKDSHMKCICGQPIYAESITVSGMGACSAIFSAHRCCGVGSIKRGMSIIKHAVPPRTIVNLPADTVRVRYRMRNSDAARAFVKRSDRIEHWIICPARQSTTDAPETFDSDDWKLGLFQGANITKDQTP
jgi:hypothetical protein